MKQIKLKCPECDFECIIYYDGANFCDPGGYCPSCGDLDNHGRMEVIKESADNEN